VDQTIQDWEAIVINNFSPDHTVDVVSEFKDKRITLINFANSGVIGASRNQGIRRARSPWIAFLDSDDVWYPTKLENCLRITDGADVITHRMERFNEDGIIGKSRVLVTNDFNYTNLLFKENCLSPTATIVRKKLLDKVGGFSEETNVITAEDFDLWLKLSKEKVRFYFLPDVLTKYRIHNHNSSGSTVFHMNAGLNVLKIHYTSLKKKNIVDRILFKRICAIQYYGAGRQFQKNGIKRKAILFYLKCFARYPFYLKVYLATIQILFNLNCK